jgi:glycosyltransferase involved in cell wall biosynthesis
MHLIVSAVPTVTVLMPVYNCELYIKEAIDSILSQTFSDFEFLIIDDASADRTVSIIKSYIDSRIKLIEKPLNTGLINSLNLGLQMAKGIYIARMDGDDISLPNRFAKQVAFLDANQDITVCGSCYTVIGNDTTVQLPEHHDAIKLAFLKGNCMAHSSIMMRKQSKDALPIVYDSSKETAEDFDLWVRLALQGSLLYNLQEVLFQYRMHNSQVSNRQNLKQMDSVLEIKHTVFNCLELNLLPEEKLVLDKVINDGLGIHYNNIALFRKLQIKLLDSNIKNFFEPVGFKKGIVDLEKLMVKRCFINKPTYQPTTYFNYLKVKQDLNFKLTVFEEIKLIAKSFIFFKPKNK